MGSVRVLGTGGLPDFQGCLANRGHGPSGEYVAGVCALALQKFQDEHYHIKEALAVLETALRRYNSLCLI